MERADRITKHRLFKECLFKNKEAEKDRIYCCHGFEHFMDVARIGYIVILENSLSIPKEIMYSAALLHDIGRFKQYEDSAHHTLAGAEIAKIILADCGFSKEEIKYITDAILCHGIDTEDISTLSGVLAYADKKSRMCMQCDAIDTCKWKREEMNLKTEY